MKIVVKKASSHMVCFFCDKYVCHSCEGLKNGVDMVNDQLQQICFCEQCATKLAARLVKILNNPSFKKGKKNVRIS